MSIVADAPWCRGTPLCEACEVRMLAVCRGIDPGELPQLAALATCRRVESGRMLFDEGDAATEVYTMTSGVVRLSKLLPDGRRQIVGFMLPGDFLGMAFGGTYAFAAEAVTAVVACRFARPAFLRLLDEHPGLEKEILARTSTELAIAQAQMLLLGRKTARERLASFLLGFARRSSIAAGGEVELPMGRTDIADHLGLTIETVSRTFSDLRRTGLITLPSTHAFVIRREAELTRLADG